MFKNISVFGEKTWKSLEGDSCSLLEGTVQAFAQRVWGK